VTGFDSIVFFIWSDKDAVANHYAPDTVTNFQQFIEKAEQYGCRTSLQNALNELFGHLIGQVGKMYNFLYSLLCVHVDLNI